jgi:hypothetical protein
MISLVLIIMGAIGLVIPRYRGRRNRPRNLILGAIAAVVTALILIPTEPPSPAEVKQIAGREKRDRLAAVASARQEKLEAAKAAADQRAELRKETKQLWRSVVAASEPCDAASKIAANAASSGDVYRLYEAAKTAEDACRVAHYALRELDAPASSADHVEEAFESSISKCAEAALMKQIAYSKIAEVADGNVRPSAVTDARDSVEAASSGSLVCAAAMMAAAAKAGVGTDIFNARS